MSKFNVGDKVKIIAGAKFLNGNDVPQIFIGTDLYIMDMKGAGFYRLGQVANAKRSIGAVHEKDLVEASAIVEGFEPYTIITALDQTKTYIAPDFRAAVKDTLPKSRLYTVVFEANGYGRLKNDRGWIDLEEVRRV